MKNNFSNRIIAPALNLYESTITNANIEFTDFTGFELEELLGKSLKEIGDMLKINSQILNGNIDNNYSRFIFTKSLEAREVNISLAHSKEPKEEVYTFFEKTNSRLEDKLLFVEQVFIDNIISAAVFSVPDLILLKANQRYLDFMDAPFNKEENSLGRSIRELSTRFEEDEVEAICNTFLETHKTKHTI